MISTSFTRLNHQSMVPVIALGLLNTFILTSINSIIIASFLVLGLSLVLAAAHPAPAISDWEKVGHWH